MLRKIKSQEITSEEARTYLGGHLGYFKIADTYNLEKGNTLLQKDLIEEQIYY